MLMRQGFFWVANRPEVVWEWSTAGASRRFAPYGRWMPSVNAKSGTAATLSSNLKLSTDRGSGSKPLAEAMSGSSERNQRLVFIGVDLRKASALCSPLAPGDAVLTRLRVMYESQNLNVFLSVSFPAVKLILILLKAFCANLTNANWERTNE